MSARFYHIAFLLATASCGDTLFPSGVPPLADEERLHLAPLANAGGDREVLRGYPVRLDARGSYHPAGRSFSVTWEQVGGEPVLLSNVRDPTPYFAAPLDETKLSFKLVVDDGAWRTTDTVHIYVRRDPYRLTPRVRAGADRVLGPSEVASPRTDDIAGTLAEGVIASWETVTPHAATPLNGASAYSGPAIYRLRGERDGLGSAPDYLLLHLYDEARHGSKAPSSALAAPVIVAPGEVFVVDAGASTDPNGDALAFFWEQTRGEPVLNPTRAAAAASLTLTAPVRPQEISLRVHVSDGLLSSTPAEVRVVVRAPEGNEPPTLAAGQDVRTRPQRTLVIDVDSAPMAGLTVDLSPYSFMWQQTHGPAVELAHENGGRRAIFTTPLEPADFAFVVFATNGSVESNPAAWRVTSVPPENNDSPQVFVCASTLMPSPGQYVALTAQAIDPEGDALVGAEWSQPLDQTVDPLPELASGGGGAACSLPDDGGGDPAAGTLSDQYGIYAPTEPGTYELALAVCDELGACGEAKLELVVSP